MFKKKNYFLAIFSLQILSRQEKISYFLYIFLIKCTRAQRCTMLILRAIHNYKVGAVATLYILLNRRRLLFIRT